jgi:hypothetical protein
MRKKIALPVGMCNEYESKLSKQLAAIEEARRIIDIVWCDVEDALSAQSASLVECAEGEADVCELLLTLEAKAKDILQNLGLLIDTFDCIHAKPVKLKHDRNKMKGRI